MISFVRSLPSSFFHSTPSGEATTSSRNFRVLPPGVFRHVLIRLPFNASWIQFFFRSTSERTYVRRRKKKKKKKERGRRRKKKLFR